MEGVLVMPAEYGLLSWLSPIRGRASLLASQVLNLPNSGEPAHHSQRLDALLAPSNTVPRSSRGNELASVLVCTHVDAFLAPKLRLVGEQAPGCSLEDLGEAEAGEEEEKEEEEKGNDILRAVTKNQLMHSQLSRFLESIVIRVDLVIILRKAFTHTS
ncbi:uncharacterized protein P884DRAFT_272102 [Thermothelomyces heterothallicus CBS 202.75]|uniref:uncharacterized protein n=1 Tax=Thermothelomyces heterothallicus CBS 202.75 TaxID=1149848 RepID=UPI003742AA37